MRWNVVIGGQLVSKSLRGFLAFEAEPLHREGPVAGLLIFGAAFLLLFVLSRLLPLRDRGGAGEAAHQH
jgi:predicted membrane protein